MSENKFAVGLGIMGAPQEWGEIVEEYPDGIVIKDKYGRTWPWEAKFTKTFSSKKSMELFVNKTENRPSIPF